MPAEAPVINTFFPPYIDMILSLKILAV